MRSTRTAITLGYETRVEVERGVFETQVTEKKVKAEQERIFQRRLDQAMLEGIVITARFRIRAHLVDSNLKYTVWQGNKYKVNSIYDDNESHFSVIELGELI
jgi:hypothetical protein